MDHFDRQTRPWEPTISVRASLYRSYLKRIIDVILVLGALPFVGPLLLVIALAIRFTSRGPILYRQERIGKDGQPFYMLKFRTMRPDGGTSTHREHVENLIRNNLTPGDLGTTSLKLTTDPRITPVGKVLRDLSLDELPQLFNVLRGEMSIVGPRPPLPYEYALYKPWHKQRLAVLPGITGLWQVTAHNTVSFNEMVKIDLDYIERMSMRLDWWIMLMTPMEVLNGA
ncbi:MAG: sugar transferase [Candidatus Promineifilaceae bacterium]|nr:sugar transferase [Candidatus Promineifilaceae bacterium]